MKNKCLQMFGAMLIALAGLSACKKDLGTKTVSSPGVTQLRKVTPNYSYTDLILDPKPAGQNYDTYHAEYNGVLLNVSSMVWDHDTYPNLVNGVPAYGSVVVSTSSHIDALLEDASGNGIGGNQFTMLLPTGCNMQPPSIGADIRKYEAALSTDSVKKNGYIPLIDDYVKGTYGGSGCPAVTYNFRLIRCTTGSHFGIAGGNYPIPEGNTSPSQDFFTIDNNYGEFTFKGSNGVIVGLPNAINWSTSSQYVVNNVEGTYTKVNSNDYNIVVKVAISTSSTSTPITFSYNGSAANGF